MNDLATIARRLTLNGAITLRYSEGDEVGRIFTGHGKWTTLAAIGVENSLKKIGLLVERPHNGDPRCLINYWTPLAIQLREFLREHWHEIEFRDPQKQPR